MELIGIDQQFPEFCNRVRFDTESRKGSVIDVIKVMTNQSSTHCSRTLRGLEASNPELTGRFEQMFIDGKAGFNPAVAFGYPILG